MSLIQPSNQQISCTSCGDEVFSLVEENGRPKERWTPLGANASPEPGYHAFEENHINNEFDHESELSRLAIENEHLNSLLMAFTSHIAQVQFRLGQVINAESDSRELMLKSLEEFASRGIPDLQSLEEQCSKLSSESRAYTSSLDGRPQKMIEQLKRHLDDLERFAYETGEQSEPPTQAILEKQRLVLEGLREKLELNISNVDKLPAAELQQVVDKAVNQFLNPVKVNEKLVEQLKTQVNDLERFIDFLHGSGACSDILAKALADFKRTHQQLSANNEIPSCCNYSNKSHTQNNDNNDNDDLDNSSTFSSHIHPGVQLGHSRHLHSDYQHNHLYDYVDTYLEDMTTTEEQELRRGKNKKRDIRKSRFTIINLIQRAITLLNLFAASQLGQDPDTLLTKFNMNKHSTHKVDKSNSSTVEKAKTQHWGTIRARLEIAINMVQEKVVTLNTYKLGKTSTVNLYSTYHTMPNIIHSCTTKSEIPNTVPSGRESPDGKASMPICGSTIRSYASLRKGFSQDEVPGTQIALPVQNLHDASLRALLYGGRPDRIFSNPTLYNDKNELTSCTGDMDDTESGSCETSEFLYPEAERAVVHVVRRYLCPALRDLIEHGLIKKALQKADENSPLGLTNKRSILLLRPILNCLDSRSRNHSEDKFECLDLNNLSSDYIDTNSFSGSRSNCIGIHAWDVLMRFYQIKNGPRYNESPVRKLCESFDLDTIDGKTITNRQKFFSAMGNVLQGHVAYKRSKDAKFKAFISIALNTKFTGYICATQIMRMGGEGRRCVYIKEGKKRRRVMMGGTEMYNQKSSLS
ncbi:unnamed protein product [Schistosoma rodhaini]|uniref:RUN domain-containing protein n=1 Tax=Schistosoma rodhaini TaxID=6188 RepID=A0AA85G777_9TREM|nr:unnamed protein product [Schistosoma rodhaini]CAH8599906.1 unnamed protein product [Schistosoma rodhaini]